MFIIYAESMGLCLAENDLELKIFLPSLPKCQDYRQELYKIKVCVCVCEDPSNSVKKGWGCYRCVY